MDFIRSMISRDWEKGKYGGKIVTRFPPEPNGFLHIGHAKAICLNFGIASEYPGGRCHLRFDDTNPGTEKVEYAEAMKRDIRWLGFDWGEHLYHASDYFEKLFSFALVLVRKGLAYVDASSEAEIREQRGTVTRPGTNSPYRNRSFPENRDLFMRMKKGEFPDGSHVLRAKIDMAHPNMVMRDPILYRIRRAVRHYRRGNTWAIYPLYDFAHCLSDSIEGVTHSLCTLEFDNNREIYDWLLEHVDAPSPRPEQTEFARLVLDYVITSKRKLRLLVEEGRVRGWDDPRMPTLAGLRRRGVTPEAIRDLCRMVGVAKAASRVDAGKFDFIIRNDLNRKAPRAFCVLDPLKVVITNYPEGQEESFSAPSFPRDVGKPGTRELPFGRVVYIDREDFAEVPPPGFRRLVPGGEVRLKYACVIRCESVVKDPTSGRVTELRCTFDPASRGAKTSDGRKIQGTIHWVAGAGAVSAEVRLLGRLFAVPDPLASSDFMQTLNPNSERVVTDALVEPGVAGSAPGTHYQFERHGYFFSDPLDSSAEKPVFNRTVTLRNGWRRKSRQISGAKTGTATPAAPPKAISYGSAAMSQANSQATATSGGSTGGAFRTASGHAFRSEEERTRFQGFVSQGVPNTTAASLARSPERTAVFRAAADSYPAGARSLASWLVNEVARVVGADGGGDLARLHPQALADLARAVDEGGLSRRKGRAVLEVLLAQGGAFLDVRGKLDLTETRDENTLNAILEEIIEDFPDKAVAYRNGKRGLLNFFVGEVMKRSEGKADPKTASRQARILLKPGNAPGQSGQRK